MAKDQLIAQIDFRYKALIYIIFFQVAHTIFFLIRDGWHFKAASIEEMILDTLTVVLFLLFGLSYLQSFGKLMILTLNEIKNFNQ